MRKQQNSRPTLTSQENPSTLITPQGAPPSRQQGEQDKQGGRLNLPERWRRREGGGAWRQRAGHLPAEQQHAQVC